MLWLKLLLSVLVLAYLGWALDISDIFVLLKTANWGLVMLACLCLIVGQIFSAIRWTWLAGCCQCDSGTLERRGRAGTAGLFLYVFPEYPLAVGSVVEYWNSGAFSDFAERIMVVAPSGGFRMER